MKIHWHFQRHPPEIRERKDGSLQVTYRRLLLRRKVRLLIDAADLKLFLSRAWNVDCFGVILSGYSVATVRLHRLIAGVEPGVRVRFANGNRKDCRRCNLVVGGRCHARGLMAPGLYPRYKATGTKKVGKIINGIRTFVRTPEGKLYREFSFEKLGMERAAFRALQWRVATMRAVGRAVAPDLEAALQRARRLVTAADGEGTVRVNGRRVARELRDWQHEEAA